MSFIGYKSGGEYIITLEIPNESPNNLKRSNVVDKNYAKFRCQKAKVLSICHKQLFTHIESSISNYDPNFVYTVGEWIEIPLDEYDTNIEKVCKSGIHFYTTYEAAYHHNIIPENGIKKEWYESGQLFI